MQNNKILIKDNNLYIENNDKKIVYTKSEIYDFFKSNMNNFEKLDFPVFNRHIIMEMHRHRNYAKLAGNFESTNNINLDQEMHLKLSLNITHKLITSLSPNSETTASSQVSPPISNKIFLHLRLSDRMKKKIELKPGMQEKTIIPLSSLKLPAKGSI